MEENLDFDIMKLLNKENEVLKKFKNEKLNENETLNSLLFILQLQRDRINFLEEENKKLANEKIQLELKIKNYEFKIPFKESETKSNFKKFSSGSIEKDFSYLNFNPSLSIKNFTNFEVTKTKNNDLDIYKKKSIMLEKGIKEKNKRFNEDKRTVNHRPFKNGDMIYDKNSLSSFIDLNTSNYDSRKKTLTPISNSVTQAKITNE